MNAKLKIHHPVFVACAAAIALTCASLTSNAYTEYRGRTETVKFADLDLSTQDGAAALYDRIHAAARHVCVQPGSLVSDTACMKKAEGEAIGKVNAALLTAFYQEKTGSRPQMLTAKR
jgi:UrcA family protein